MSSLTRFSLPLVLTLVAFSLGAAEAAPNENAPSVQAANPIPFGFTLGDAQQPTTSHVAKLGSDIAFPPGTFDGALGGLTSTVPITGKLNIPPTDGYFVAFRFMGTTGRVEIVPDGDATGTATVHTGKDKDCKATQTNICADTDVTAKVFIKLSNVKVDGKALEVGPDCRTAQPASVTIKALVPISLPAPPVKVTSTFSTPAFAGCTGHEDLSRLLTGLVSGPGNTFVSNLTLRCFSAGCKQA
ncbi:hypothetical protein MUY14_46205 [Amycolatopsis sp. FBCC-B4732]|uniref:hypothetical protein n=1 Tax=Amycolatopsis sp. FBCC-B4732 TaxID=3079339 RepID=UPI001FF2B902|nr:hypothetical protein [Amycolatopsis sp. FBCC-B4732]UOX88979.1 hypothetical protein MUY14_46205 [Amycolatopsis sp. FBCC-B4732]